jgi:hypothetical protein
MRDHLHAALMLGVAVLGYAGWALYWTTDLFVNVEDPFWNRYEDTFVAADLLMCTAFLAAAVLLVKKNPLAVPFGIAAAGAMVFLVSLDTTFNLRNGHYRTLTPVMVFEVGINLLCLSFGPFTVVRLWRRRRELEQSAPPLPVVEREGPSAEAEAGRPSWVPFFQFCTRVNAGLTAFFGVLFVAAPLLSLGLLGLGPDAGAVTMVQAYGCSLLFLAVLCWWFRSADGLLVVRGLSAANCVEDGALAVLLFVRTLWGPVGPLGWLFTGVFVLEVVAYGVLLVATPAQGRGLQVKRVAAGRPFLPAASPMSQGVDG